MPVLGSRKISALGKLSHAVSPPAVYRVYLTAVFLRRVEVPNSRTKNWRRGWDSNPRMEVLQGVRPSLAYFV